MRKVFVHIGMHKTGSTSIQRTFQNSKKSLMSCSISYLPGNPNHSYLYQVFHDRSLDFNHGLSASQLAADEVTRTQLKTDFADRLAEIRTDHLLISGEELSRFSLVEARDFLNLLCSYFDEIKIICFVRSPASFATSYAQEAVLGGRTLEQELESPEYPRYREKLGAFIGAFGYETCHVFDFDALSRSVKSVVESLCQVIVLHDIDMHNVFANRALSQEAVQIVSLLNARRQQQSGIIADNPEQLGIPRAMLEVLDGNVFQMPTSWQREVIERSRDDIQWLSENFNIDYSRCSPQLVLENANTSHNRWWLETVANLVSYSADLINDLTYHYLSSESQLASHEGRVHEAESLQAQAVQVRNRPLR